MQLYCYLKPSDVMSDKDRDCIISLSGGEERFLGTREPARVQEKVAKVAQRANQISPQSLIDLQV